MKKLATWKPDSCFYHNSIFVLISKSKKGRYRYETFSNEGLLYAGFPFRTRKGAVGAAKEYISQTPSLRPIGDWTKGINPMGW
jgi:hypothetical protein